MTVYVAGHNGMVGSAILRHLHSAGVETITRTRKDLDLTDQAAVRSFMKSARPSSVILAAAKVGGIHANSTYPAQFIYENLMIQTNVIHQAFDAGITKLLFLGSSCIYPREAAQPMMEGALLTGPLEATNEPYAIAKIAGIKLCESYNRQYGLDYRSVMPTNLYGPGDNFHTENSHVLPSLIRRFHEAKQNSVEEVIVWGDGLARREFLHVDDMAEAAIFVANLPRSAYLENTSAMQSHINIGQGSDISISGLAEIIRDVVGFRGRIVFDPLKPQGPLRKLLNVSRMTEIGWKAKIDLKDGIAQTYRWFLENEVLIRSC